MTDHDISNAALANVDLGINPCRIRRAYKILRERHQSGAIGGDEQPFLCLCGGWSYSREKHV